MAKLYGFDDAGRREYRQIRKVVLGGGTRSQTKVYKKWERGRGGGGSATLPSAVGMVMEDVPLAESFASMSGTPSLSWTVTPGQIGPDPDYIDEHELNSGVLMFDWARNAETKEEYVSLDGVYAPYDTLFEVMTPIVELVNGDRRWAWRKAVNRSKTDIRASSDEPVFVAGQEKTIRQGGLTYRWFIITDVMDFRALPGFVVGSAPTGDDDPDLQIPFHRGGNTDFELNSEDCAGA